MIGRRDEVVIEEVLLANDPPKSSSIDAGTIAVVALFWAIGLTILVGTFRIAGEVNNGKKPVQSSVRHNDGEAESQQEPPETNTIARPSAFQEILLSHFHPLMIPTLAASIGFAFSVVVHSCCNYFKFSDPESEYLSVGLWSASYPSYETSSFGGYGDCVSTLGDPQFYVDRVMNLARVAGLTATILGGIPLLYMVYCVFFQHRKCIFKTMIRTFCIPFVLAFTFQMLTLGARTAYPCHRGSSCELDSGAYWAITAALYWLITSVGVVIVPLPTK